MPSPAPATVLDEAEALVRAQQAQLVVLRAERDEARRALAEALARLERRDPDRAGVGQLSPRHCARTKCGALFAPRDDRQTYCSAACKNAEQSRRARARDQEAASDTAAAPPRVGPAPPEAPPAEAPARVGGPCERCGRPFTLTTPGASGRFCSRACYERRPVYGETKQERRAKAGRLDTLRDANARVGEAAAPVGRRSYREKACRCGLLFIPTGPRDVFCPTCKARDGRPLRPAEPEELVPVPLPGSAGGGSGLNPANWR